MKPSSKHPSLECIYGFHAVFSALKNPKRQWVKLFLTPLAKKNLMEKCALFNVKIDWASRAIQEVTGEKIDAMGAEPFLHQGYFLQSHPLPALSLEHFLERIADTAIVLLLDGLTDPHNVGAIIRSAAALKADAVITTHYHSVPQTATLTKTASGAMEIIPYIKVANLCQAMESLKKHHFWCYGLAEDGKCSLSNVKFPARTALVLGSEDKGIRPLVRKQCDEILHLPTADRFSTLNVSNAAALALYETAKQVKETL